MSTTFRAHNLVYRVVGNAVTGWWVTVDNGRSVSVITPTDRPFATRSQALEAAATHAWEVAGVMDENPGEIERIVWLEPKPA